MKIFRPFERLARHITIGSIRRGFADPPHFALAERHVANARLLPDRRTLLQVLPKQGTVAEIGVDEGAFSEEILRIVEPRKLHLVDAWGSSRFGAAKKQKVETRLAGEIASGRVQIDRGFSTEVVSRFPNAYFDWVYIDTTHAYELTLQELIAYSSKVNASGIIAGHDYVSGNWKRLRPYGVIEAVHQFCVEHDWEILHLTADIREKPSFAIRRIV